MVTFKTSQTVKPPEFRGSNNPLKAKAWLKDMAKSFEQVQVGENQKTAYASYFLKNEANG